MEEKMKKNILILVLLSLSILSALNLKVHYIDVMQGDAILIQYDGHNYLIDSGKSRSDDKPRIYLQSLGVETINACLMTHPDYDHYGEFEDLIECELFDIQKMIKNQDDSTAGSYWDLMDYLESYQIPIEIVDHESELNWSVQTDILSPDYDNGFNSTNNNSIVIKLTFGNFSFLFTGDSEEDNNNFLLDEYDMDIDILKVAHHGALNGTNLAFVQESTPVISVISSGNNSFGHPSYDVIEMLEDAGSFIYSTADDWNTWQPSNGSDDQTTDDDVIVETDGVSVWVNDELIIDGVGSDDEFFDVTMRDITNYPNPFNPSTTISFNIQEGESGTLTICNMKGQTLVSESFSTGDYEFIWNAEKYSSGVYLINLTTDSSNMFKKIVLMK
jgi:competence protein ComEC